MKAISDLSREDWQALSPAGRKTLEALRGRVEYLEGFVANMYEQMQSAANHMRTMSGEWQPYVKRVLGYVPHTRKDLG